MTESRNFELKSPDEILNMKEALAQEILELRPKSEECDRKLMEARTELKKLIPDVTEIQTIANQRSELLERKRKLERKILALYSRYPNIISGEDQHQIMSTDETVLKRQLDSIKKREETGKEQINGLDRKIKRLTQKSVDLQEQNRLQMNMLTERDMSKAKLTNSLNQELETSKNAYFSDLKNVDKTLTFITPKIEEMKTELNDLKEQYQRLVKEKSSLIGSKSSKKINISKTITSSHKLMISNTKTFLNWWTHRRLQKRYEEKRIAMLKEEERFESNYSSTSNIKKMNVKNEQELKSLQTMNKQLEQKLKQVKEIKKKQKGEIIGLKNSLKPLPAEISRKLKELNETLQIAQKKGKSLEITMNTSTSDKADFFAREFDNVLSEYRTQIIKMVVLQNNIKKKRQELEDKKIQKKDYGSLSSISIPGVLISEEGDATVIQAGPLEELVKLLFEPSNDDLMYSPGLLVLFHTEKFDFSSFVNMIISAYENANVEVRDIFLKRLIDVWTKWFPNDFSDVATKNLIVPLINILGTSGSIEPGSEFQIKVKMDSSVPFDPKIQSIPFCAEPSIIVEHFTYIELQLLKSVPASEFLGCGWTAFDRWDRAPNIMKMTDHFNLISQWIVASLVLAKDLDARVELVNVWLKILDAACEILNFQLIFIIFGAFCNPLVSNLSKMWETVFQKEESKQIYDKVTQLTNPSARFLNYRNELEKYPHEVVVPYIGPMLTSLVYISDGNPSKKSIPDFQGVVLNFQKHRMYSAVIQDIMVNWGKEIRFTLNKDLLNRMENIPPVEQTESELFQLSRAIKD